MNSAAILFYIIYLLLLDYITEISCCPSKSEFTGEIIKIGRVDHPEESLDAIVLELLDPFRMLENHIDVV